MVALGLHARRLSIGLASLLAIALPFLCVLHPDESHAARKGVLWIKVVHTNTGKPIPRAKVTIKGTAIRVLTDNGGEVGIELVEGKFTISILKDEYYNSVYPEVEVEPGKATHITCELAPGNPDEQFYFGIGGINIVSKKELLPEKIETTHEISSAEIEHNLSTNLGDVLTLVPGVERTEPPGLSDKTQAQFRGTGNVTNDTQGRTLELFGTKVILDDIVLSNNANLQRGSGTTYSGTSQTAGSGIDLRTIPADNIEKVEVITGVPSAEYGDLTGGLVKVQTKKEKQPHRLKVKSNPDTKEANLSGGFMPKNIGVSYNLNYAYSERDIRKDRDEYSRYNGQFTIRNKFSSDRASLLNKFYYTGVLDEANLDPNDPLSNEQYNRDKTYMYGLSLDFKKSERMQFFFSGSVRYTKRDSYSQRLTGADVRVLTDAREPGTNEGVFDAGAYLSRIWVNGEEWNAHVKGHFRKGFEFLNLGHSLLLGGEYTFDDNFGQGQIYDPLKPPGGNPGQRPVPFDASPALHTANVYLEDEINGILLKRPWILNLGLRYEMYRPSGVNFDGLFGSGEFVESKNGSFNNPRVRLRVDLFKDTRIRLGWGKSSKMPPMTSIYNGLEYIDVVEENISPPPDSVPLVSTYVFDFNNPTLKGYQNEKGELSLDQKIGSVAAVLTGFYSRSENMPRDYRSPIILNRYSWTGWPDPGTRSVIDTIYTENDSRRHNIGWNKNYGVEAMLTTRRIKKLSTLFRISLSYVKTRGGAEGVYMSTPREVASLNRTVYPFYNNTESWRRKMIINYSADWFFRPVGMWTTFFVQQTLFDAGIRYDDPKVFATAYYDPVENKTVHLSPAESESLGLDRILDPLDLVVFERPNDRFLFNVNVTKSIGRGAELSFFVHNFFDDAAYYVSQQGLYTARNHNIFYGVELSMVLDELFRDRWSE